MQILSSVVFMKMFKIGISSVSLIVAKWMVLNNGITWCSSNSIALRKVNF